mmetsp:Transcript_34695/g.73125  ORF Transcript_34695/g.73125 Transcript_34695/m.73125 type:complete len:243 (-) Transcript_34695:347-1075(-)
MENSSSSIIPVSGTDVPTAVMIEEESTWAIHATDPICASTSDDDAPMFCDSAALQVAGWRIPSRIVGRHISFLGRSERRRAIRNWDAAWGTCRARTLEEDNLRASTTWGAMVVTKSWPKIGAIMGDLVDVSFLLMRTTPPPSSKLQRRRTRYVKQINDDSITSKSKLVIFSFCTSPAIFTTTLSLSGGEWEQLSTRHFTKLSRSMKFSNESQPLFSASLNPSSSSSPPLSSEECPSRKVRHS